MAHKLLFMKLLNEEEISNWPRLAASVPLSSIFLSSFVYYFIVSSSPNRVLVFYLIFFLISYIIYFILKNRLACTVCQISLIAQPYVLVYHKNLQNIVPPILLNHQNPRAVVFESLFDHSSQNIPLQPYFN